MSREQDSPPTVPNRADYDSPWKKALEVYFKEFIDFFFPDMAETSPLRFFPHFVLS